MKKNQNFLSENFHFLVVNFSVYLNRRFFVMDWFCLKVEFLLSYRTFYLIFWNIKNRIWIKNTAPWTIVLKSLNVSNFRIFFYPILIKFSSKCMLYQDLSAQTQYSSSLLFPLIDNLDNWICRWAKSLFSFRTIPPGSILYSMTDVRPLVLNTLKTSYIDRH